MGNRTTTYTMGQLPAVRVLIIDDDLKDTEEITLVLTAFAARNSLEFMIYSDTGFQKDSYDSYDLYIIDIAMKPKNGFQIAEEIWQSHNNAVIIFCTNHDQLVFESFQFYVFYFVRKKCLKNDMDKALTKYRQYSSARQLLYHYQYRSRSRLIPYSSILYFEVLHNTVYIHMTDGSDLRQRCSLSSVASALIPDHFVRISQCYLLNMQYILEMRSDSVILNQTTFRISAGYQKEAASKYSEYIMKNI